MNMGTEVVVSGFIIGFNLYHVAYCWLVDRRGVAYKQTQAYHLRPVRAKCHCPGWMVSVSQTGNRDPFGGLQCNSSWAVESCEQLSWKLWTLLLFEFSSECF